MILPQKLHGLRIIDFTGELGPYASKLYANLGADVIHVEPVGGDPMRLKGPFYKGRSGIEDSLLYQYYNTGKRGITLDLNQPDGQEVFRKLCLGADMLFESCAPDYLKQRGLSYSHLKEDNPKLVHTSITPFGHWGELSNMPGSDLTCSALGGFLYLAGVDGDKPVRSPDDQAYRMAEAYAAVGSSIALFNVKRGGTGQHVDVSCIESVAMALENAAQYWDLEGKIRRGRGKEAGTATIHPCEDGFVVVVGIMGKNKGMWDPFIKWMCEEGVEDWQEFDDPKWIEPSYRSTKEAYEKFCKIFEKYSKKHNKLYLYETGQRYRVSVTPVNNGQDLLDNPQLEYRDFWEKVPTSNEGEFITMPGAPYKLSGLKWDIGTTAPRYGQHTCDILKELDYSPEQINNLIQNGGVYAEK